MKHILIIFAVLLVLMILISSFGGSIRQLTETKVLVNPPSRSVGEEYNIDSEFDQEKPSPYSHLEYEKAELEASSIIAPYDLVQTYATL